MKNKLVNFLLTEVTSSVDSLVRNIVTKAKKATIDQAKLVTMVAAAVNVLDSLGRTSETRYLFLFLVCHYGDKGLEMPEPIASLFAAPETTPPAPVATPQNKPAPPPAPATVSAPAAIPTPSMAPARTLASEQDTFKKWLDILKSVVSGGYPNWKSLQKLTIEVFASRVELTQKNWELLFSAMKIADGNGKFIISNGANPAAIFTASPLELLSDYLFGLDGVVPSTTGAIKGAGRDGMPSWLQAKASIVLDGIGVMDARLEKGLGAQEEKLFDLLLGAIENADAPTWLAKKAQEMWGEKEASSSVMADQLKELGYVSSNNNGHKLVDPETKNLLPQAAAVAALSASAN